MSKPILLRCSCGRKYTREEFEALEQTSIDESWMDWRRCRRCHASVVAPVDATDGESPRGTAVRILVEAL